MKFCELIKQRREHLGLAQREIAEAILVDVPMYSRYERGQRCPKEEHIPIMASKLGLDYTELRKLWVADKVLSVVNEEDDASGILNIAATNINKK